MKIDFDILTVKELKHTLQHLPEDAKIILSMADLDKNILTKDFSRNISISSDNRIVILGNKPLFSINPEINQ